MLVSLTKRSWSCKSHSLPKSSVFTLSPTIFSRWKSGSRQYMGLEILLLLTPFQTSATPFISVESLPMYITVREKRIRAEYGTWCLKVRGRIWFLWNGFIWQIKMKEHSAQHQCSVRDLSNLILEDDIVSIILVTWHKGGKFRYNMLLYLVLPTSRDQKNNMASAAIRTLCTIGRGAKLPPHCPLLFDPTTCLWWQVVSGAKTKWVALRPGVQGCHRATS